MFNKTLEKHKNLRILSMMEKLIGYNFVFHHVSAENNKIADCLSRLTRQIKEAEHFSLGDTRLGDHRKVEAIKSIKKSNQFTEDDLWVEHLGNVAMSDKDYLTMIHHIEAGTDISEIDKECELSKLHNYINRLSVHTLKGGQVLILRDNIEILISKKERNNILHLAHATNHRGIEGMVRQMRGRIFWEGMNGDAKELLRTCEPCQINAR